MMSLPSNFKELADRHPLLFLVIVIDIDIDIVVNSASNRGKTNSPHCSCFISKHAA
jgi:hypothetical protein